MHGIDANILVHFPVRDSHIQFEKTRKLIKREIAAGRRVFVNQLVLMEAEWVLHSRYVAPKQQIIETISGLLSAPLLIAAGVQYGQGKANQVMSNA